MSTKSPFVVSASILEDHLYDPSIKIIDASWYLPSQGRDARAEFDAGHIPGAVFFDHDRVVDPSSPLPHTFPTPDIFAEDMSELGIANDDRIVVYDGPGMFSAPRVWWMLRVFGADNVVVLDGGIDLWKAQGRPLTDKPTIVTPTHFRTSLDKTQVVDFESMFDIVTGKSVQIADARGAGRFEGIEPEPRPGVRSGHMPGARNVPFTMLSENGILKSVEELTAVLTQAGLDLEKPIITSCGSGITAAVISLALASIGHEDSRLYDGSWSEWGSKEITPVITGK